MDAPGPSTLPSGNYYSQFASPTPKPVEDAYLRLCIGKNKHIIPVSYRLAPHAQSLVVSHRRKDDRSKSRFLNPSVFIHALCEDLNDKPRIYKGFVNKYFKYDPDVESSDKINTSVICAGCDKEVNVHGAISITYDRKSCPWSIDAWIYHKTLCRKLQREYEKEFSMQTEMYTEFRQRILAKRHRKSQKDRSLPTPESDPLNPSQSHQISSQPCRRSQRLRNVGPRIENKPQGQTMSDIDFGFDFDEGGDDEVQNSEQGRDGNEDEDEEMDFSEEMLTPLTIIDGHAQVSSSGVVNSIVTPRRGMERPSMINPYPTPAESSHTELDATTADSETIYDPDEITTPSVPQPNVMTLTYGTPAAVRIQSKRRRSGSPDNGTLNDNTLLPPGFLDDVFASYHANQNKARDSGEPPRQRARKEWSDENRDGDGPKATGSQQSSGSSGTSSQPAPQYILNIYNIQGATVNIINAGDQSNQRKGSD